MKNYDATQYIHNLYGEVFNMLAGKGCNNLNVPHTVTRSWSDDNNAYVEFDMPGVAKADVEVKFEGNVLSVKGTRKVEKQKYSTGSAPETEHAVTYKIPTEKFNTREIEASMQDGVLTVTIPKAKDAQATRVKVK